jgi:hypothetical protein
LSNPPPSCLSGVSEKRAICLAWKIARELGWFAYDAQMGSYMDGDTEKKPVSPASMKNAAKKQPVKKKVAAKTPAKKRAAKSAKPRRRG